MKSSCQFRALQQPLLYEYGQTFSEHISASPLILSRKVPFPMQDASRQRGDPLEITRTGIFRTRLIKSSPMLALACHSTASLTQRRSVISTALVGFSLALQSCRTEYTKPRARLVRAAGTTPGALPCLFMPVGQIPPVSPYDPNSMV
jgi:hypothetical protein